FFQSGIRHANVVLHEMSQWMEEHEYESIQQMRGSMSRRSVPNPSAFDRANYIRVLSSYTLNPRRTAAEAAAGTRTEGPNRVKIQRLPIHLDFRFDNRAGSSHLWLRNVFHWPTVQHVGEATVQPGFAGRSVMPTVNRFVEHMRVVTSEASNLLFQP